MANILIKGSQKHNKDCHEWCPLQDGTKTGDTKYCDLSLLCRQIGMKTDRVTYKDPDTGEFSLDYFCTGFYAKDYELGKDEEIS